MLPRFVRDRLRLVEPVPVYWHLGRRGEAVLTLSAIRTAGAPDTTGLVRELADAHALIARLRKRDESRDRSLYAEGYNAGYLRAQEVTLHPHGKAAETQRRRQMYAHVFPDAAKARQRPARRRAERPVETVSTPVLAEPVQEETPA